MTKQVKTRFLTFWKTTFVTEISSPNYEKIYVLTLLISSFKTIVKIFFVQSVKVTKSDYPLMASTTNEIRWFLPQISLVLSVIYWLSTTKFLMKIGIGCVELVLPELALLRLQSLPFRRKPFATNMIEKTRLGVLIFSDSEEWPTGFSLCR